MRGPQKEKKTSFTVLLTKIHSTAPDGDYDVKFLRFAHKERRKSEQMTGQNKQVMTGIPVNHLLICSLEEIELA